MSELIIVRHAERPEIAPNAVGNEVLLTEKGKQEAYSFGKKIEQAVVNVSSSPIGRCMQTAEILVRASASLNKAINLDKDLGDPGYIIENGKEAWQHWQNKGHESVNQHLLSGVEKWSGFVDLNQASVRFSEKIYRYLKEQPSGKHIWVTHDTILAAFASRVLRKPLTIEQWPQFLDYLSIKLIGNKLEYSYFNRGEKCL